MDDSLNGLIGSSNTHPFFALHHVTISGILPVFPPPPPLPHSSHSPWPPAWQPPWSRTVRQSRLQSPRDHNRRRRAEGAGQRRGQRHLQQQWGGECWRQQVAGQQQHHCWWTGLTRQRLLLQCTVARTGKQRRAGWPSSEGTAARGWLAVTRPVLPPRTNAPRGAEGTLDGWLTSGAM